MPPGNWFWIIYVIVGIMGGFWGFTNVNDRRYLGGGIVFYILLGLLGWGLFGSPISGGGMQRFLVFPLLFSRNHSSFRQRRSLRWPHRV